MPVVLVEPEVVTDGGLLALASALDISTEYLHGERRRIATTGLMWLVYGQPPPFTAPRWTRSHPRRRHQVKGSDARFIVGARRPIR